MTRFQKWIVRQIVRQILQPGGHWKRLQELLTIVCEEWNTTFHEDNRRTKIHDLKELFGEVVDEVI